MEGIWSEVLHGDWYCDLEVFKSLRVQRGEVVRLKDQPIRLRLYLEHLNFSHQQGSQGGLAKGFAQSWMPIYRQRIFFLNALYLLLINKADDSENLRLAIPVVKDALHRHILIVFNFLEIDFETGGFAALHDRLEPFTEMPDKVAFLLQEMTTSLQQYGFTLDEVDNWHKQRILFRTHALGARLNEAFKEWKTQRFFNGFHLEIERLIGLSYLGSLSHARSHTLDAVMGVPNRASFDNEIERWIKRFRADGHPFVCGMLDLDHFKAINDKHGHAIGDFALKCAAQFFQSNLSSTDFIARYGGEEFVVLFEDTNLLQVKAKMDNVILKLANTTFDYLEGEQKLQLNITASCGLAECEKNESQIELFNRADKAMYEAKALGRNRVVTSK